MRIKNKKCVVLLPKKKKVTYGVCSYDPGSPRFAQGENPMHMFNIDSQGNTKMMFDNIDDALSKYNLLCVDPVFAGRDVFYNAVGIDIVWRCDLSDYYRVYLTYDENDTSIRYTAFCVDNNNKLYWHKYREDSIDNALRDELGDCSGHVKIEDNEVSGFGDITIRKVHKKLGFTGETLHFKRIK